MVFNLLREDEVVMHAFLCFANEGGELRSNGSKIIESVQIVDDEGGAHLDALKFFLPEIEHASPTEFMQHMAGDDIWVYIRGKD